MGMDITSLIIMLLSIFMIIIGIIQLIYNKFKK